MTADAVRETIAYHDLTKHRPGRFAPGPGHMDWANQPDPFRRFAGARQVPLPLRPDGPDVPFRRLHDGSVTPGALTLENLALLLEVSMGLAAWKSYGDSRWPLRCNPSSGNLHPTEAYLVTPDLEGLAAGVYHYSSVEHALEQRGRAEAPEWSAAFGGAGVVVGLSSIYWRESWKYGARAFRYCQHDTGHAIAAIRYAAAALGWRARLLDGWSDAQVGRLLGLDRDDDFRDAEREEPDGLLWVGPGTPEVETGLLAGLAERLAWAGAANRLSRAHVEWPPIDAVHAATVKPETPSAPFPAPDRPPLEWVGERETAAGKLFRGRRSAVEFDGATSLTAPVFLGMLDALLPREGGPPWDALPWSPRVHPLLFVHRVEGLTPGLYLLARRPDLAEELRGALGLDGPWEPPPGCPPHLPLYLLLPRALHQVARAVSCGQDIAADSAFAVSMLAEFAPALETGPWWYRWLHWEAGMLGQVLYLEAEAAGVRGTGIGCFLDDEMHSLLGLKESRYQVLYHFTVGGAVEDMRLTTLPPYEHLDRPRETATKHSTVTIH